MEVTALSARCVLAGVMPRSGVAWEFQLRLDQPVRLFALATAALATLALGLFAAFTTTRRDLVRALNSGGRLGSAGPGQSRMRSACCVPAWRAMRVEPVVALRQECSVRACWILPTSAD